MAQQQEKLLAELALAYEQESEREREELESGRRAAFDKEMEARVKAMNLTIAPEEIEGAFEEVREVCNSIQHDGTLEMLLRLGLSKFHVILYSVS